MITIGRNIDGNGNAQCVSDGGNVTGKNEIVNICNPPLQGRYVHVKLKGSNKALLICEIQVYGDECE